MLASEVSAVVVTRGGVDLSEILASLDGMGEVVVWDNSVETDLAVYGRYAAIERCRNDVILAQDDDCVIDAEKLVRVASQYPLGGIIANMDPGRWDEYPDSCLVGYGAVFHRGIPQVAFDRFTSYHEVDEHAFRLECDVVFTVLTPHAKVDVGHRNLPWAEDPARAMYLSPRPERDRMYDLARQVRDA